jgi:hypothetical protein
MNSEAVIKIKMLKGSMRCFTYGVLGLLPVIGLPFALAALWTSGSVRAKERQFWNAAKPYRVLGAVCAATGSILWCVILTFIIGHAILSGRNDY